MKKAIAVIALTLFIANTFWSCEKDDICADGTPTTPGVVIEFYDKESRSILKNVTNLKVIEEFMGEGVPWDATGNVINNTNKIIIPLRTDTNTTTYRFFLNANATNGTRNEDVITFNYSHNEVYVSRACGYKTLFNLNPNSTGAPVNPALTDTGDELWIAEILVEKTNIEDENEAHIKIYF